MLIPFAVLTWDSAEPENPSFLPLMQSSSPTILNNHVSYQPHLPSSSVQNLPLSLFLQRPHPSPSLSTEVDFKQPSPPIRDPMLLSRQQSEQSFNHYSDRDFHVLTVCHWLENKLAVMRLPSADSPRLLSSPVHFLCPGPTHSPASLGPRSSFLPEGFCDCSFLTELLSYKFITGSLSFKSQLRSHITREAFLGHSV